MSDTPQTRTNGQPRRDAEASTRIVIPEKHPMVTLLGAADSLLRVIEQGFPQTDIHVRGNEVTATGDRAEIRIVEQLFNEMMLVLRTGQPLTEDAVERSIASIMSSSAVWYSSDQGWSKTECTPGIVSPPYSVMMSGLP